ncbi:MAG: DNA polymerase III subunit delta' [Myxococcales bacterium]
MPLSDIEGRPRTLRQLRAAIGSGRIHHAYLFAGPPGVGKERAAVRFAQALNCEADPDGCGACVSCRLIERGTHPDVITLAPERTGEGGPEEGSREIRVDQVRVLCGTLQLAPVRARQKVAVLLSADRMNAAGQNALLKTLEEPPPQTTLVLVTDADERLLPTIRSRCLRIAFGSMPVEVLARKLAAEGMVPEEARLRASLARGSAEGARRFDEAALHRREELCRQLQRILASRGTGAEGAGAILEALDLAEVRGADRDRALESLRHSAWYLRDALLVQGGGDAEVVNFDRLGELREAAARLRPAELLDGLEAVRTAIAAIEGNGAPRLQLEAAFLRLAGTVRS